MRAYVCDGTPSRLAQLSEWLTGQVSEGLVQASSLDQQARLTALLSGQRASGTLRLTSGRVYPFSIPQVPTTARVSVFPLSERSRRDGPGCLLLADRGPVARHRARLKRNGKTQETTFASFIPVYDPSLLFLAEIVALFRLAPFFRFSDRFGGEGACVIE